MPLQSSNQSSTRSIDKSAQPDQSNYINCMDGHQIPLYIWTPHHGNGAESDQISPRGVLQISHGLAEHAGRYHPLAEYLTKAGFVVVGHDHRGHGRAAKCASSAHYSDDNGWSKVVNDLDRVANWCQTIYPNLPHFLLAHSMGSFITLAYLQQSQARFAGVILSGSNYTQPARYKIARKFALLERLRLGRKAPSKLMDYLSFGNFNKPFKPNRTPFDWLSRDTGEVDSYIADIKCGQLGSTQLWCDFLEGLAILTRKSGFKKINKKQSFLLIAGDQDPVGQMGKGMIQLRDKLRSAGCNHLTLKLYPGGRHEMLNETNRVQVLADCWQWISEQTVNNSEKVAIKSPERLPKGKAQTI